MDKVKKFFKEVVMALLFGVVWLVFAVIVFFAVVLIADSALALIQDSCYTNLSGGVVCILP